MAIIPLVVQGLLVLAVLLPAAQTYLGYIRLQRAPLGFRPDDVVVANILVRDLQTDRERFLNFQRDVLTQLAAIPGVARVALSNSLPAAGEPPPNAGLYLDDHTLARAFVNTVSPGYFALLDIGLSKGRTFEEGAGRCQLVVNESFASRHRVSAGSTVRYAASTCDVIGVAANVPYRHDGAVAPTVYQSIRDGRIAGNLWAFVEAHGAVTSVIRNMPRAIQSAPGRARSVEVGLLQDHVRAATATTRLYATTGALPVVFALFLVAVSTFAAASLGIRLRFRACAISLALGATPRRLVVELGAPIVAAFTIATVFGLLGGQLIASALQERFVGIEVPSFTTALGAVLALWAIVAFAIVWLLILIGRIDLVRGMRAP